MYTVAILAFVPDILTKFPMYDAMAMLVPVNFITLGIIGGGFATTLKRANGHDIRGRFLEVIIVTLTLLLTCVTSGLVRGFFGDPSKCLGVLDIKSGLYPTGPYHQPLLNTILVEIPLKQIKLWYHKWDMILSKFGFVAKRFFCAPTEDGHSDYSRVGCSPATRGIKHDFYLDEDNGSSCSADMALVNCIWLGSMGVMAMGNLYREMRARRNNGAQRGRRRPHQD